MQPTILVEIADRARCLVDLFPTNAKRFHRDTEGLRIATDRGEGERGLRTLQHALDSWEKACETHQQGMQDLVALLYKHMPAVMAKLKFVRVNPSWHWSDPKTDWDEISRELREIEDAALAAPAIDGSANEQPKLIPLTANEAAVLEFLGNQRGKAALNTDIATGCNISGRTVTAAINGLEEKKLAQRLGERRGTVITGGGTKQLGHIQHAD